MNKLKNTQTRKPENANRRLRYARLERRLYFSAVGVGAVIILVVILVKHLGVY